MRILLLLFVLLIATPGQSQSPKVVHVYVALCDNENQGIVPVSKTLGNGQDPGNNLYWGALYGVKTHFKRSKDWKLLKTWSNPKTHVMERCLFQHASKPVYLVADAYDGKYIKNTITDFMGASAGEGHETINWENQTIAIGGKANLITYVGHNGLMEFDLDRHPMKKNDDQRDAIMLCCISRSYFREPLRKTGARPLVWTTGLMAPEAYTLEWALRGWVIGEDPEAIRTRAANAYNHYQKCGIRGARGLLVTGW